ncbi:diguanylate cyclase (GGDEF)-like protein [Luteibacter rhizovicinus]|uniref:Diguanylate cyclase (GGDEF)-like protein n=1 Tax=Luteibacter rhizovicinus TaxID=242606 RepID=A0A4R3YT98_9GAMM|nr:EAL domain-containing protein [Luteibacter rhizovicinus]TCV95720.1 diguanylate cyclase (GGDEF)-like protein [Luteibacter rhizovicinus]
MTIASEHSTATTESYPGDYEPLHGAVERLFRAADAELVADECRLLVTCFVPDAKVTWRNADAPVDDLPGHVALELAVEPRTLRVLDLRTANTDRHLWHDPVSWVGRLAAVRLRQLAETANLYEAISRLALAERLQRALYAIAEQAGAEHNMKDMMSSLHSIVGSLMYAENFFIVLFDAQAQTVRFPYFVDSLDPDIPDPEGVRPIDEIEHSLTWYLLHEGRSMMGASSDLELEIPGPHRRAGPPSEDWLGVPMKRGDDVVGALVVQSYRDDTRYTENDRELLTYVAQHVQTALERRQAHEELERRVTTRTAALREANRVLRQQVLQRQRGERLQAALFRIAELANTSDSIENFYAAVHRVIGGLLYARNFYIALLTEDQSKLTFPYSVDEVDGAREPRELGRGLTEFVLRNGKALLADRDEVDRLHREQILTSSGARSLHWLGVPLIWNEKSMGVLAVQSYSPEHTYSPRDQELLTFVSYHIANALQRKYTTESLKQAYASLERRVTERTRALALANRDLREQIAERERVERRLKYETLHDSLTGLPNRTLLLQRLEQALNHYHEDPTALFAVLFIDLDRFKVINDSVGHLVGDDLLFQVGGRVRACLKTRDVVARLGGDEFAVLVEGITDPQSATQIAERIIDQLQAPFRLGPKEIFTSASIGIALPTPEYKRPEELLRDADSAMYRAKDEGRHRAAVFDDRLRREALSLLELEGDLRRALTRNEFVPYYQPIVELADSRVVGYEALLRWRHPERGLLAPADFLSVAEDTGCAEAIDWQIFQQVCLQARALARNEGFISINVSGSHFRSPNLDQRLLDLLAEHDVPARSIRVEVTERALLENPAQVKRMLDNLRAHGVGIALDDFGTGYSSLSYLHQYPIETLKIDRSFVVELSDEGEGHSTAVVRAIQALADSLKMQVIAEGIETESQKRVLQSVGCRYGQGFLFAQPAPATKWLRAPLTLSL